MRLGAIVLATVMLSCGAGAPRAVSKEAPAADAGAAPTAPSWSGTISIAAQSASDMCERILPSAPAAPVVASIDARPGDQCMTTTADGAGDVLAACWSAQSAPQWSVFSGEGVPQARFLAYGLFWPTGDGLLGFSSSGIVVPPIDRVMHVAADGTEVAGATLDNDEHPGIVNRRFGAGLVAAGLPARSPNQFAVTLYDGTGALESLVHPSRFCFDGAAVAEDASGMVALAGGAPGTPLCLRFVDPRSGDSSESLSFNAPDPDPGTRIVPHGTWIELFGVARGGIAVFANGVPLYVAQPSSNVIVRAPEWLTNHPRETFRVVRGGTANALARSDVAGSVITLVSPAGEVCGTISVTDFAFGDIGADGTLVGSTGPAGAVKVWWPGLLR